MIPKPNYTTYNIYIRDESEEPLIFSKRILNGLTMRIPIPNTTENYRIPHELASHIEAELQTYMLTNKERQQAKQEEKATYGKGLYDAWEAARKIVGYEEDGGMNVEAIKKIFGTHLCVRIFKDFDVYEAINKIKEYEENQDKIKVGDEVIKIGEEDITGIVTGVFSLFDNVNNCYILWPDGSTDRMRNTELKKTGRHIPQIEELLKAMKGEKS